MSGRGRGATSRWGRGRGKGRGGRGRASPRGAHYSGTQPAKHKGLCEALGPHVFDYGNRNAADQMSVTYEKIVSYVGSIHGTDISNELLNRTKVVLDEPEYTPMTMVIHAAAELRRTAQERRMLTARQASLTALRALVVAGDTAVDVKIAQLQTEIEEAAIEAVQPLPIKLVGTEKTKHENAWRSFRERDSRLEKQRGLAFSIIKGQCTKILLNKMQHDADWEPTSLSYDPLVLMKLIEKTILSQTEDQYPFATVYDQLRSIVDFNQNTLLNNDYYDKLNTKVDVADAIGVEFQHPVLQAFVADEKGGPKYTDMNLVEQAQIRVEAQEIFLSYIMLRQSGKQHTKLRVDLQNDFTTGNNRYPKDRQQVLHLLDKYSKTAVAAPGISEGQSFSQFKGDPKQPYDTAYWKDKECYNCGKTGHPSNHCRSKPSGKKPGGDRKPKAKAKNGGNDDSKSVYSKTSKASTANSMSKLQQDMKKSFVTLANPIMEQE